MKIKLIAIGETEEESLKELFYKYEERLSHYCRFQTEFISLRKKSKEIELIKKNEGELLLSRIKSSTQLIILDEKGVNYSSETYASFIQKRLNSGMQELVFLIGGAYGFSKAVYERADFKISLSQMTFTHQMVRLIFIEQLYRAFTIIKGQKYHH